MSKKNYKKHGTVHSRIRTKKGERANIMKYIKHLITLVSWQEIILHNLEQEVEKDD